MSTRNLVIPGAGLARSAVESRLARHDERRSSGRTTTLYRTGLLGTARDSGLCTVRNICDTGLLVVTPMELACGEKVQVSLSETVTLWGHVSWTDGSRVGVELMGRIDVATLLQGLAAEHRLGVYRARRLAVNADARLTSDRAVQTSEGSRRTRVPVDVVGPGPGRHPPATAAGQAGPGR